MSESAERLVGEFPIIPRQERALQKRQALLESGHILFLAKGYDHTTAKEIAKHAGVAIGTFYRYFSDKRQLLLSLLKDQLNILIPPIPDWFHDDPVSLLASMLEEHNKQLNELGLYRVLPELLQKDSELREVLAGARNKIHSQILANLEQLREKGLTWIDLDLNAVTWTIIMIMQSISNTEDQSESSINYYDISKIICRLIYPPVTLEQLRNEKGKY